ncbi:MAG: hypothetical protein V1880_04030 [Patescibacteria group bacterium]
MKSVKSLLFVLVFGLFLLAGCNTTTPTNIPAEDSAEAATVDTNVVVEPEDITVDEAEDAAVATEDSVVETEDAATESDDAVTEEAAQ